MQEGEIIIDIEREEKEAKDILDNYFGDNDVEVCV